MDACCLRSFARVRSLKKKKKKKTVAHGVKRRRNGDSARDVESSRLRVESFEWEHIWETSE